MKVLIVEDEPVIAQRLQRFTKEILANNLTDLKWIDDIDDAESYLLDNSLDLLLLDLNLHGSDGFELLAQLNAASFQTIIVSAYAEQAIRAFEYGVLDFVAKPFNKERLQKAFQRFESRDATVEQCKHLAVKKTQGIILIPLEDVEFIKADGHYTELNLHGGKTHLHEKSINNIELILPTHYMRVHRSYIANMQEVSALNIASGGAYQLTLRSGCDIPVSRSYFSAVKSRLAT